jgi:hypothetical protein
MSRAHRRSQLRQFASLDPMHAARLLRKVKFRIVVGEQLEIHVLNEIQGRQCRDAAFADPVRLIEILDLMRH